MRRIGSLLICFIISGWSLGVPFSLAAPRLPVFVSIVPQQYFVQQIGGDLLDVQVMVQPGASPATYEPKPSQMTAIAASALYFAIGVPFESAWLDKISAANPRMRVIRTDQGITKHAMATHAHEGEHRSDPEDSGGILDPHIWLSPPLVKIQARTICDALVSEDPGHGTIYKANCERFISELTAIDRDLGQGFKPYRGRRFMVFHPSWGYFAQAYGLTQIPIEVEGKAPKPAQLTEIITLARKEDIRVIFVQPQFSTKSATLVAKAIGGRLVAADPLALDWPQNLKSVAAAFAAALR
ncbi:MAG: zinc ABC transporter substrate-binding protein [Pseudomonadota bacterium]